MLDENELEPRHAECDIPCWVLLIDGRGAEDHIEYRVGVTQEELPCERKMEYPFVEVSPCNRNVGAYISYNGYERVMEVKDITERKNAKYGRNECVQVVECVIPKGTKHFYGSYLDMIASAVLRRVG